MTQIKPINVKVIIKTAKASNHDEAYRLMEKYSNYRIGVGARIDLPDVPSLFLEVLIKLSAGDSGIFNLSTLEKSVNCLKKLHKRGYSLTYEDDNWVSCEKKLPLLNPNEEYLAVSSLLKISLR